MVTITSYRRKNISAGYVFSSPVRMVAFGFGAGLAPRGPGTIASLLAIPVYNVMAARLSMPMLLLVIVLSFIVGMWCCGRTGREMGIEDHGGVVWDEIVAMWLILVFVPTTLIFQLVAFGLFRFFDIAKPGPVGWAERQFRGGFGVMLDDIVAAFLVLLMFSLWKLLFGWPQWISRFTI